MREIEGLEHALEVLKPKWEDFNRHFEEENAKFLALLEADHDSLGRILKAHLILEHYLTRYLESYFSIESIDAIRLSFAQKAELLPSTGSAASVIKLGVKRLNAVRNRFAHRLDVDLDDLDVNAMEEVIRIFRPEAKFEGNLQRIEAFMTIAVTFLIVPPPDLQQTFADAFSQVRAIDHEL
ncbi:hypothetical protein [Marinobacter shengliensis]|uniref:hypothetical protein n=1 Tax=Marinobacter shengliensis TaxID=1389223 RepID=UPI000D0EACBD|nr:hypothetical protein [Marinobacter shengliensis]PSF10764.1 hypothetical protein C7H10_13280 [Marinobacter shengliensis]